MKLRKELTQNLKSSIDTPWIGTFHSIFAKFFRKHSQFSKIKI